MKIYPLTITLDRYDGTYSHGKYLAWRFASWEVPTEPFEDDVTCYNFWGEYSGFVGIGDTINSAVEDLKNKLYKWAISLQEKYSGPLSLWLEAVELCDDEKSAHEFTIRKSGADGTIIF